jgi:16S rRNA (uracil1498-N3)-methyltransferase
MAKTTPRLMVDEALSAGRTVSLAREQGHYLTGVLRLASGDAVRVFNGRDGEWLAHLADVSKKQANLRLERKVAEVSPPPDMDFVFAPLKHARLDYMVQKATELGARRLRPVITGRTVVDRVNLERMRANAIEAAEQCNLVFVPEIVEPVKLGALLAAWDGRALIHCDEMAAVGDPVAALRGARLPAAVLTGPEGGFTDEERAQLRAVAGVVPISLGPRIMRADTAAVAALTLAQAVLGDWS